MRALGHIRDDERPAGLVHHEHLVGGVFVPESVTLPARIDDQQGQSCTGSYALLVESFCAARGIACDPVSRRFTYTLGRQLGGGELRDVGARPRDIVSGMRDVGIVAEATCPSGDLAQINNPVEFFAIERAITYRVKNIAVIEEDGEARCAAIRQALAAGFPVALGLYTDPAFEAWRGDGVYDGNGGGGGHAVRVCAYRGDGAFGLFNSWGPYWGLDGMAWVSPRFIGGPNVFDAYLMSFAPSVHE